MHTHYCTMRDYISMHIKLIAMPRCRMHHNHKSSADSTHATDTCTHKPNKILCTPLCSDPYLFPVVLRHHSDSLAVCFTVTVALFSVYKYCSSCASSVWSEIMWFKAMFPESFSLPFHQTGLNTSSHTLHTSKSVTITVKQTKKKKKFSSNENKMLLSGPSIQHLNIKITMAGLIESGLVSH